jgi:hypothetical protein
VGGSSYLGLRFSGKSEVSADNLILSALLICGMLAVARSLWRLWRLEVLVIDPSKRLLLWVVTSPFGRNSKSLGFHEIRHIRLARCGFATGTFTSDEESTPAPNPLFTISIRTLPEDSDWLVLADKITDVDACPLMSRICSLTGAKMALA